MWTSSPLGNPHKFHATALFTGAFFVRAVDWWIEVSLGFPDKCWDICVKTSVHNLEMLRSGGLLEVQALDMPLIFQHLPMLLLDKAVSISLTEFFFLGFSHQHSGLKHPPH